MSMIVCGILYIGRNVVTEIFERKGHVILHNVKLFIKTKNKPVYFLISKKYEKGKGIIAKNLINL